MDMFKHLRSICLMLVSLIVIFGSCKDPYNYDDEEPSWLGSSIYDYLEEDGNFTYFTRIIDSCNYTEVLAKTGSKTMFVCRDSAFEAYFADNEDGITCFEDFNRSMLNRIMEYSIVNDANLIELLSSDVGYVEGQVMRRATSLDPLDLLDYENDDMLPEDNKYFAPYKDKGIYILNDNTSPRLIQFFQAQMTEKGITDEDFSILFNGKTREANDAHLFDVKVIERDITCKNGYIHVLEDLLMPQPNMAEYIRSDSSLSIFNSMMDRYSAPYYNESQTQTYKALHPDFTDSIFVRHYYTSLGPNSLPLTTTPDLYTVPTDELLLYDPGWNAYVYGSNATSDMGVMFIPSDQAMTEYFSENGEGSYLYDRYKYWDSVPNDIAAMFINAHMKYSFLSSLPSKFNGLKNETGDEIGIKKEDVIKAKVTTNGAVYVTNTVYPPVDYASVMAPVLVGENTKVFNYAVRNMSFDIYLRSMESFLNPGGVPPYTFIVPTDDCFGDVLYPATQGHDVKEMIDFKYDSEMQSVDFDRYEYNETTGERGALITDEVRQYRTAGAVNAMLNEMMDYHIVVADVEDCMEKYGQEYFQTKGKGFIRICKADDGSLNFYGGGNMEQNKKWGSSTQWNDPAYTASTTQRLVFRNGRTYFVDKSLQQPLQSVYAALGSSTDFSAFFTALMGVPEDQSDYAIFSNDATYPGLTMNVKFFTAYHYTLYVPSNEAMAKAYADGLPTWADIENTPKTDGGTLRLQKIQKVVNFLKYHFQDNSVFIKGDPLDNVKYESATKNDLTGKFFSLRVTQDGENLTLIPTLANETGRESFVREPIQVKKDNGLYNIMTRDYFFGNCSGDIKSAWGSASDYSSRTTIHQIGDYLKIIKAPVITTKYSIPNTSKINLTVTVTDNGDGVVFDNHIVTKRGICWNRTGEPTPTNENDEVVEISSDSDLGSFEYSLAFPSYSGSDTLIYVRAYAESKWTTDGTDGTLTENASKGRIYGYGTEYCIDIKNGKRKN